MRHEYSKYDGQPFPTVDSLFQSPEIMEFILTYGEDGLDALERSEDEAIAELVMQMLADGLLERDDATGKLKPTPKLVRGFGHQALMEMFEKLRQGRSEGHAAEQSGRSDERTEGTHRYEFGDRLSEVDMASTMRNLVARLRTEHPERKLQMPARLQPADFEIFQTESRTDVALCLLLDMSGSMFRYRRFINAKRVVLGLMELMRTRFPNDTVDLVGFSSMAEVIRPIDLPMLMPKPVTIYDSRVRYRVPLDQAREMRDRLPQHFTNLQMGLRLARRILARRGGTNKQIFIITDGQPTAHIESSEKGGEMLYLLYPPDRRSTEATLNEAWRCRAADIRINTFALVEEYWGMDWVGFVDRLNRLCRGAAFYSAGEDMGALVIESYLSGRKKKSFSG
ncbi:MAG: VWA domain-containing protein [Phycisphaeraceae bacterium]|nr:VWA domain-containing protein [Phycisphaeraceae bacterium]